ncbi:MAG: HAMP domain-containing protein [Deltaproteobacteria bacterium]|nr:HAMP domain-containing protein [Deltaproteobacteria bacterium]
MKVSIKKKVLTSLVLVALVAVASCSILAIMQAKKALKNTTVEGFENVAEELFYTIRHSVQGGIESAAMVADDPVIKSSKSWTWQKEEKLKQLKGFIKAYEDITLINPSGNVITSTDYNFRGSWKHKAHFKRALKGEACASNVRLIPNPTKLVISFAAPVFNKKKEVSAVIAMQLNLNNISRMVRHIKIGKTGHAVLLDEYNRLLVHADEKQILEHSNDAMASQISQDASMISYLSDDGKPYLGNYFSTSKFRKNEKIPDKEADWKVVVIQTDKEVFQNLAAIRWQLLAAGGFILIVIIAVALVVSKTITDPIKSLQEGAEIIRGGNLEHRVEKSSNDEIGELAESFNNMAKELAEYQGSLEQKVEERTAELSSRNRDMRMVLENVDQGFITVFKNGVMAQERSAVVDKWLGGYGADEEFVNYIRNFDDGFADWFEFSWESLFEDIMPIEVSLDQLPKHLKSNDQELNFSYSPIYNEEEMIGALVVIADITEQLEFERKEVEQREILNVFKRVSSDKGGYLSFQKDADELVARILSPESEENMQVLKRDIHTLKGNTGLFGLGTVSSICHEMEDNMDETGGVPPAEMKSKLKDRWESMKSSTAIFTNESDDILEVPLDDYNMIIENLQGKTSRKAIMERLLNWQLEPVEKQFNRISEQAKALAIRLGKGSIEVDGQSGNLRLDAEYWAPFWSTLSHVIRNAVDHGLEDQERRKESKKEQPPKLSLATNISENKFIIEVADNGKGIDWDRVAKKAEQLNLPTKSKEDLIGALFADGFSTNDAATETSGRGVGLAAIKDRVANMSGSIDIESEKGKGTRWRFEFPKEVMLGHIRESLSKSTVESESAN